MTRRILGLSLFLVTSLASAAITDLKLVAPPESRLVDSGSGTVVASGTGAMFLAYGQRVALTGELLDPEPIVSPSRPVVSWQDGWLALDPQGSRVLVEHLSDAGELTPYLEFESRGEFVAATSLGGNRLAVVELSFARYPRTLWVTVTEENRVVQQRVIADLDGAAIAPFDGGFLLVTHVRSGNAEWRLHAWRLDSDGTPRLVEDLGVHQHSPTALRIAANGDRAIVAMSDAFELTAWTVDRNLHSSSPVVVPAPAFSEVVLAVGEQFMVPYRSLYGQTDPAGILIIDRQGGVTADVGSDPIAAADRIGDRYFVVRPWGGAAIATGDPRVITSRPVQLTKRVFDERYLGGTVISGDVTLVTWGTIGVRGLARIDANGAPIELPELGEMKFGFAFTAPEGFIFLRLDGNDVKMRRLARRGGWIDPQPRLIATLEPEGRGFSANVDADDLVLVQATGTEFIISRFTLDGTFIERHRVERPGAGDALDVAIGIASRGDERLVTAQQTFECRITCVTPELFVEVIGLDRDARPIAPPKAHESESAFGRALPLGDGTWVLPQRSRPEVFVLARDGSLLRKGSVPVFVDDAEATATGWRALTFEPSLMAEFTGADTLVGLTGISGAMRSRFAAGERLVFQSGNAIWSGRVEAGQGDVSLRIEEVSARKGERRFRAVVRNEGNAVATNVQLWIPRYFARTSLPGSGEVGTLAPGEERHLSVIVSRLYFQGTIVLYSDDFTDVRPADNFAKIDSQLSDPPLTRTRGARR